MGARSGKYLPLEVFGWRDAGSVGDIIGADGSAGYWTLLGAGDLDRSILVTVAVSMTTPSSSEGPDGASSDNSDSPLIGRAGRDFSVSAGSTRLFSRSSIIRLE